MTLILSCLTNEHIVQVSDKRLTWKDGRPPYDGANKIVILHQQVAFSYTGRGHTNVEGKTIDLWLGEVLWKVRSKSYMDICSAIASNATVIFWQMPSLWDKRHSFVGIGWIKLAVDNQLRPIVTTISNALDHDGGLLPVAQDEFGVTHRVLPDSKPFHLEITGQPMAEKTKVQTLRLLRRCVAKNAGPIPMAQILCGAVRATASRNETVGRNLLVVSIPRSSFSPTRSYISRCFFINSLPSKEVPTFLYVPQDESEAVQHGPVTVDHSSMMSGIAFHRADRVETVTHGDSLSPFEFPAMKAIVLTHWNGSGSFTDKRHPAIADDYTLNGCCDFSGTPSWPQNQECPYCGFLLAIDTDDGTIERIDNDARYLVVQRKDEHLDAIPDGDWFLKLRVWLLSRRMVADEADEFVKRINRLTRKNILEELREFLKTQRLGSDISAGGK